MNKPEWGSRRTLSTGTVIEYEPAKWADGVLSLGDCWAFVLCYGTEGDNGESWDGWAELFCGSAGAVNIDPTGAMEPPSTPLLPPPSMLSADREERRREVDELISRLPGLRQSHTSDRQILDLTYPGALMSSQCEIDFYYDRCGAVRIGFVAEAQDGLSIISLLTRAANILQVLQAWLAEVQK